MTKSGTGRLILQGTNGGFFGNTTITAGTLQGNTNSIPSSVTIHSGAVLDFDQAAAGVFSGQITDMGSLVKSNSGALRLSSFNTYSGGTTVNGGSLIGYVGSLTGDMILNNNSELIFDTPLGGGGEFVGNISGNGSVTKTGPDSIVFTGTNSYFGGTLISEGLVRGDTSSLQGNIVNNTRVVFLQGTNGTYAGQMSGSGALTKLDANTLILTGTNTYSGGTFIMDIGTLKLSGTGSLRSDGTVSISSGTFDISALAGPTTIGDLIGSGQVILGANTLTFGGLSDGADYTGGHISGTGGLQKPTPEQRF